MRRILLIDDEKGIRELWSRLHDVIEPTFRGQCSLDVASDIPQGLARLSGTEYDAVILDLRFPDVTVDETISMIFERSIELPIISVLTGDEDIYTRRRCMLAGAADFWLKNDATSHPDLFFKSLYNAYLKRYASREPRSA